MSIPTHMVMRNFLEQRQTMDLSDLDCAKFRNDPEVLKIYRSDVNRWHFDAINYILVYRNDEKKKGKMYGS